MCISLNDVKPAMLSGGASERTIEAPTRGISMIRFVLAAAAAFPWATWWVEEDLNLRPYAYQAYALTT
jgi:hypothetical protein